MRAKGLLLAFALGACERDMASGDEDIGAPVADAYQRMTPTEAPEITLAQIGSLSLGSDPTTTPASIKTGFIDSDGVYIVDDAARMLRGYSRAGRQVFTRALGGDGAVALHNPVALVADGDSLLVLELSSRRGLHVLARDGTPRGTRRLDIATSTVGLATTPGRLFVATTLPDDAITDGRGRFIQGVGPDGESRPFGCTPDPRYAASLERQSLTQMFRFVAVTSLDGAVYCAQPVSPIVQVLQTSSGEVGSLRRAPPFYVAPEDVPQSLNQKAIDRFRASWTMHKRFYPLPNGFASVYSAYDTVAARDQHSLFVCDSTSGTVACATASLPGAPLGLLRPDTLVVLEPVVGDEDLQRIGFYALPVKAP